MPADPLPAREPRLTEPLPLYDPADTPSRAPPRSGLLLSGLSADPVAVDPSQQKHQQEQQLQEQQAAARDAADYLRRIWAVRGPESLIASVGLAAVLEALRVLDQARRADELPDLTNPGGYFNAFARRIADNVRNGTYVLPQRQLATNELSDDPAVLTPEEERLAPYQRMYETYGHSARSQGGDE